MAVGPNRPFIERAVLAVGSGTEVSMASRKMHHGPIGGITTLLVSHGRLGPFVLLMASSVTQKVAALGRSPRRQTVLEVV